ncbi:MAG: DUF3048 domain-containing protein [Bacilli bacterium]
MAKRHRKKKRAFPIVIFLTSALIVIGLIYIKNKNVLQDNLKIDLDIKTNPKLKIINEDSNKRSIAVMINNHPQAVLNHAGLQDAYLVYEIIVEGGYTRMMAIFKDKNTEKIGSVRSSRHYFLDYAMENDAIYVHYGWSPKAQADISSYSINNINGLYDSAFWRDNSLNVAYEHKAFTSMEKIQGVIDKRGYRNTSSQKLLLNYSVKPIDISNKEDSMLANKVVIPYSNYQETSYQYDTTNQVYKRFINGKEHIDAITKKQYTAKNIIIQKVSNYSMDNYGRQDINNVGSGDGYFITNGSAVPINWSKSSRQAQTIYKYSDGSTIEVNDGNTYIQIQPINQVTNIS